MTITSKERRIDTGHGQMTARRWQQSGETPDSSPPIVLFHDSLGCIELWRDFPALLAECSGHPVIAYDRLGFGLSDRRTDKPGLDFIEEEATQYLPLLREQLNFDRFIAFGHSVGGCMAVYCAALNPASCLALVTESTPAFVDRGTLSGIIDAREQFMHPEQFTRLREYHGGKARWVMDAWLDTWLLPQFADWSLREVLPQVRCPVLAIHGGEDEYCSEAHPKLIAELTSGPSQLEIMPATRHLPHREHEQWVAERVAQFLKTLPSGQ